MHFMQTELVLQTKNRSEPAKNRFSVALPSLITEIDVSISNKCTPQPLHNTILGFKPISLLAIQTVLYQE